MFDKLKQNLHYIIYLLLLVALAYLFQSSSSKYEKLEQSKRLEISLLESQKSSLSSTISILEKEQIKLSESLKKANKQLHVIIKKSADGSYTKEIISNSSSESSNKALDSNKESLKVEDLKIDQESVKKDLTISQESSIMIKEEKSRNNNLFLIIGGVALCFLAHVCAI